jgi:hypothetical protein
MDVILIFNGLGNQMSQYALYLRKKQLSGNARFIFSKKSKKIHNGYELEKVFGIKEQDNFVNRCLYSFYLGLSYKKFKWLSRPIIGCIRGLGFKVVNEDDNYNFQPRVLASSPGITFYTGGWHSEKYFRDIKDTILNTYRFDTARMGPANMDMLHKIGNCPSVSVHVRRGDFLDSANYPKFGSVCTLGYFQCAIRKIRSLVDNPHFFFFTNDHAWVREHFSGNDSTVVDINAGGDSWKDMFLISNCAHNINSNGTFSWWSSYLNPHPDKIVIVPRHFIAETHFEDIYPEDWIQLSDY